jgi:hypothetical protein
MLKTSGSFAGISFHKKLARKKNADQKILPLNAPLCSIHEFGTKTDLKTHP